MEILKMYLFLKYGFMDNFRVVYQIGYGILEATLEAATKWRFIPAKDDGENVKTYVENSFNIGF